jgi:hypothetical protein
MSSKGLKPSEKFEQRIKRIHDLIEQSGSQITWNDRLPDPHNPSQPRQIDITIRREGKLTLIECRMHKEKQDVKWIEELIGRRMSLNADAVIAVSATGFTTGAIAKAKAFGIILRDMHTLTEEEVSSWGCLTNVSLTFYEFKNVSLVFQFARNDLAGLSIESIEEYLRSLPDQLYGIFEKVCNRIDEDNPKRHPGKITAQLKNERMRIAGRPVVAIEFSTNFTVRKQELRIPSVVAYDAPGVEGSKRQAFIERVDLGAFEITQSTNNVFVVLDLSTVDIPANSKFHTVDFDFGRVITMHGCEIIGLPKMQIPLDGLFISFAPVE